MRIEIVTSNLRLRMKDLLHAVFWRKFFPRFSCFLTVYLRHPFLRQCIFRCFSWNLLPIVSTSMKTSSRSFFVLRDGIQRAVAFSQYPQYSCSTSGSSYNSLASILQNQPAESKLNRIKWSVIDRWPLNEGLVLAISDLISQEMSKLPPEIVSGNKMVLLFSAHSLPMKVSSVISVFFPSTLWLLVPDFRLVWNVFQAHLFNVNFLE